ncbi:LysR family transcriptional regulator [Roseomonas nepalensis]|uniref:LysR family transcriptional regulator n=1 Tax=Muricoccus nepalensis TaxID=1854500 RepID=A0A502FT62_9PROT|nr:LysR family transcriptional regulator [Roseomonas nepalensis]TPG52306.1 LysR family transcriptional regulator [Roseomonas nepalensis]
MPQLNPEAVQAFVLVADLNSFTRAARALNTTQSAISLKISRLEKVLDRRLLERTPRLVRLTPDGQAFLVRARPLSETYRRATEAFEERSSRVSLGLSHHLVCDGLSDLLRRFGGKSRDLVLDLRVASTRTLLDSYDAGELDAVVLLRHDESRRGGQIVLTETFHWMASPDLSLSRGAPLPMILQREPCKLRAMSVSALEGTGIDWREAFLGSGVSSTAAAALAGIGIAAVASRIAPEGLVDVGARLGLPKLPQIPVVLHSSLSSPGSQTLLTRIVTAFRADVRTVKRSLPTKAA